MNIKSRTAPHPGEVLRREYLEPIGLSGNALAMALHVPATRISEILHGRRGVSADTALRLERYFGQAKIGRSATEWMQLQIQYELAVAWKTIWPKIKMEVRPRRRTA
jgi:addiction module HigA family antidote